MSNRILFVFVEESSSSIIQKITFSKITEIIPQQASQGMKGNKTVVVKQKETQKRSEPKRKDSFKGMLVAVSWFTLGAEESCFESSTDSQILSLHNVSSCLSTEFPRHE